MITAMARDRSQHATPDLFSTASVRETTSPPKKQVSARTADAASQRYVLPEHLPNAVKHLTDRELEHFPLMLIHSLRGGRNWRILVDKLYEGANEFCARGPVSFAQPLFAAVL